MAETVRNVYFEDLLQTTGWGLYYKFMLGIISACSFNQGALLATFSFSMALFGCDSGGTIKDLLSVYISFSLGTVLFGAGSSIMCDRYGRKRIMCYSLITCFLISFVMAFSYHYYVFATAVALLGAGIESNAVTSKILLAETLPKKFRGSCLVFCDILWTLGYFSLASYAIFSHNGSLASEKTTELKLTNWRIMYAICGGIGLFIGCACALLEESPRYFLHVRKNYLAYLVLKQFYAINKSSYAGNFEVKENEVEGIIGDYDLPSLDERNYSCVSDYFVRSVVRSVWTMFTKKTFLKALLLLIVVKIPILTLSLSSLSMNMERQLNANTTADTVYAGVQLVFPSAYKPNDTTSCEIHLKDQTFFMLGISVVLGQLISMMLIDIFGRRALIYSGYLIGCICFMSLTLVQTNVLKFVNSLILMACVSCLTSSISVVNIECFPTALRGTAHAVASFLGSLIAILFVSFIKISYRNLNITLGILYFGISLFCIFLPEMKKQPMVE